MQLIRQSPTNILLDVSDKIIGDTIVKRKAEVVHMKYSPVKQSVVVQLIIYPYSLAAEDTYGVPLDGVDGFSSYHVELVADNTSIVDIDTGELLGASTLLNIPELVAEGGALYGRNIMFEYEYFKMVAANVPVIVDQLIVQKVQLADSMGRI